MSVSGLEAWKAPENQSKNSQNPKSCNFNAHCEKDEKPPGGRVWFCQKPGAAINFEMSLWRPFCGKKRPNMTPPTARPHPTAAGASPTSPGEHNGRLVRWECQLLEPDGYMNPYDITWQWGAKVNLLKMRRCEPKLWRYEPPEITVRMNHG